ncbi:helix-turn-helix domain-containing protein [Clostridium oryzae]|uniref:Helix-turn-helix protein n=1 Tax=Clostridium oryzae TaxID=1450648 RepID=A0A1V4IY31_9CLOT|nr:helix-turn-helix transcriptional regulator [Clostridium oryzae]OPJ64809.1 helix-turn-helix protein [Clostridium oryzae]
MSKASVDFSVIKEELMRDSEFKEEYDKLKPRYELISEVIKSRRKLNLTQEELASRMGTQKSNICRLESGNYNPSLDFLSNLAKGLGKEIHIELR